MSDWSTCTDPVDLKLRLAAEILRSRSPLQVRAYGTSMLPSLWPGDALVIENCQPSEVRVGDIIRFMQAGRFVIHRVMSVANNCGSISWTTRGDSATREDSAVSQTHLLGRVSAICRNGRSFPAPRNISKTSHWIGCMLRSFGLLPGLVLRVRFLFRWCRCSRSELAKA